MQHKGCLLSPCLLPAVPGTGGIGEYGIVLVPGRLWSAQETDMQTKLGQRVKCCRPGVCAQNTEEVSRQQGCRLVALWTSRHVCPQRKKKDIFKSLNMGPT